ncbi:GPI ethanolamine phosphate transferase 2 isoform X2 [Pleurodeles waltl]|uniref:GPI ethanolamine phosphate transferase 2 isoform X2 n=1 Tax=Pleurodeles waltl TaxID=8319 RepID=UPI003709AC69
MRLSSSVFASCCLLLQAVGVGLFLRGFFPPPIRSLSRRSVAAQSPGEPLTTGTTSNWTRLPPPLFKRVVLVMIDALREDFVFGPKGKQFMPYITQIVEKGTSRTFIAEATPPTVTMPRIKALMTGSIPGFVDVILNLNSPALLEDNLLWQAKSAGKRIVFYGDDTWIKLFPKHFVEYDGTTSFFVSDFTEVDNNVTRHLDDVLKRSDWDLLILHYLGLDHIGHLSGPNSPLVGPKLLEMDNVFKKIHTSLLSKEEEDSSLPSLLVLCGDHGMSETGSHGGSSREEVHTPLVFVSSAFGKKDPGYEQFKKGEKSHGNWIKLYLEGNASEVLSNLGKKVLKQYLDALRSLSSSLSKQIAQYDMYSMATGTVITLEVLFLLMLSIPKALCSSASFEVPVTSPLFSLLFYLVGLTLISFHVIMCTSADSSCYFCSIPWVMAVGIMLLISALLCVILSIIGKRLQSPLTSSKKPSSSDLGWSELDVLLLVGTIGHVISLASSSFIEEEHQTWYFLINTLCLALCQDMCRKYFLKKESDLHSETKFDEDSKDGDSKLGKMSFSSGFMKDHEKCLALASPWAILVGCRLLRSLNQTGVQWAHRPDFGHWLTSSEHKAALSFLTALSMAMIFILVQRRCSLVSKIAMALGLLGIYSYRAATGNVVFPWQRDSRDISKGIIEARFVYVFVLGILFTGTKDLLKSQVIASDSKTKRSGLWEVYTGLVLLAALLLRPHNLPVLVFCLGIQNIMETFVWKLLKYDAAQVTIMHYWFGQAFFYFQGNSNNIATVDISAGFVGLDGYVEIPAAFLTGFSTYAGPLLWTMHLLCYLNSEAHRNSAAVGHGCFCYAVIRSIPLTVYIILVTALRYHLFIWSVFSPKLLYEGIHAFITAAICMFFTAMDKNQSRSTQE